MARRSARKYHQQFPERTKAGKAVKHAIAAGKWPRPDTFQ